ncbi:MAG: acylphosphatase [Deltaproteobacteria bacterium]|nr:acylphosphatase [Deltaproteobacteria bacterium]
MEMVRVSVHIEGLVQGVFYRYSTQQKAQELGVNGWVRNVRDGSVECLLEGERNKVEALIRWCHQGPPGARVQKVVTSWEEYTGDLRGFSIR